MKNHHFASSNSSDSGDFKSPEPYTNTMQGLSPGPAPGNSDR